MNPVRIQVAEACRDIVGALLIETLDPAADLTTPERLTLAEIAVALDALASRIAGEIPNTAAEALPIGG